MLLIAKSFDPEFRKFRQCFGKWADEVAGNERMKAAAMRVFNNTLLRAYNKWASILTAAQNLSLEISLSAKGETMRGKTKIPPLKVLVRQAKQDAPEQLVKAAPHLASAHSKHASAVRSAMHSMRQLFALQYA